MMSASFFRSRVLSLARTSGPKIPTIFCRVSDPVPTTSRPTWSASITIAPSSLNICATVLAPVAMPPVRPKTFTLLPRRAVDGLSDPTRQRCPTTPTQPGGAVRSYERLHVSPVRSRLEVNAQGDLEGKCLLHEPFDLRGHRGDLALRHLKEKFVVHLQDHWGVGEARQEIPGEIHHRLLDDVGTATLNGCVDRRAFSGLTNGTVPRKHLRNLPAAVQQRGHIPRLARLGHDVQHVLTHLRVARVVSLDVGLGLRLADA